jgi:hypothetical protein
VKLTSVAERSLALVAIAVIVSVYVSASVGGILIATLVIAPSIAINVKAIGGVAAAFHQNFIAEIASAIVIGIGVLCIASVKEHCRADITRTVIVGVNVVCAGCVAGCVIWSAGNERKRKSKNHKT